MKRSSNRWRLRTLLVAVAVAALIISGAIESMKRSRRAVQFLQRARVHAGQALILQSALEASLVSEERLRETISLPRSDDPILIHGNYEIESAEGNLAWQQANSTSIAARIRHHKAMHGKYERAARRPWEAVGPDPPEPYWDGRLKLPARRPMPPLHGRTIDLNEEDLDELIAELRGIEPESSTVGASNGERESSPTALPPGLPGWERLSP